jgi:plastocyanin
MKQKLLLPVLLLLAHTAAFSKVWEVKNTGTTFAPSTININLGDSILFVLDRIHNAVEVDKATWDAKGNTPLANGFRTDPGGGMVLKEKLTVGTHYFVCSPHASMGMLGTIVVNNVTNLVEYDPMANITLFPNPAADVISIRIDPQMVGAPYTISDQAGKEIMNGVIANEVYETNVSALSKGIYFLQVNGQRKRVLKFLKN